MEKSGQPKEILLVEANLILQNSVKNLLLSLWHKVTVASSLEEAKARISEKIFDVLLTCTDLILGKSDHGWLESAKEFRESSPEWKIYVMSFDQSNEVLWQYKGACDKFINKANIYKELTELLWKAN
jgi:DNA-binding NtrC family response regulator